MTDAPLLLNPGPVTLSPRVRAALQRPDMCHREPEFAALTRSVIERLEHVYGAAAKGGYAAVLLTSSGSGAVESMLNSLAPREGKTLVAANGVYGERMAAMLRAAGRPLVELRAPWHEPMDLAAVAQHLKDDAEITHVVAVHNETTTGRLNDIGALADLCQQHGKALMIDAVSSFGGEEIDFALWQPLAVAATANKCLHGVPGMAFVLVRRETLEQGESQAGALYLDLFRYYREQKAGFSPFTQAVHAAFALDAALDEFAEEGGWQARMGRYRELSGQLRAAFAELGIRPYLHPEAFCSMISSFYLPQGWDYPRLHDLLRAEGYVIYAGQGDLQKVLFRIANMGAISDAAWERLIEVFRTKVATQP